MQSKEVPVAGNDIVRMPGLGALKNLVVVGIVLHHVEDDRWNDALGYRGESCTSICDAVFGPKKLAA